MISRCLTFPMIALGTAWPLNEKTGVRDPFVLISILPIQEVFIHGKDNLFISRIMLTKGLIDQWKEQFPAIIDHPSGTHHHTVYL